jgi:hypothetical protein
VQRLPAQDEVGGAAAVAEEQDGEAVLNLLDDDGPGGEGMMSSQSWGEARG